MHLSTARILTIVLWMPFTYACQAIQIDHREQKTSLRAPVSSLMPIQPAFVAKNTGEHQLRLEFPWPIIDPSAEPVQTVAENLPAKPPEFDFTWALFEGENLVARGTAAEGFSGIVDSGTAGLGGGETIARALVFAVVPLQAGAEYTIRFVPGERFAPLLTGTPSVVIQLR